MPANGAPGRRGGRHRPLVRGHGLPYFRITPLRSSTLERKFQRLREAGVVMLVGTDSGIPGKFHCQSTWNELEIWVNRLGTDPMEAIRAATLSPAILMGVADEVATVTPGKVTDVIAVHGDLLRHIALLQDVDIVVKGGAGEVTGSLPGATAPTRTIPDEKV